MTNEEYWVRWKLKGSPEYVSFNRLMRTDGVPFRHRSWIRTEVIVFPRFGGECPGTLGIGKLKGESEGHWQVTGKVGGSRWTLDQLVVKSLEEAQAVLSVWLETVVGAEATVSVRDDVL
jgi:hypothetical protein